MKKLIILFMILNLFFISCGINEQKLRVNSFELSTPLISDLGGSTVMVDETDVSNNVIYLSFEYVGNPPIRFENKDASIKYNSNKSSCDSEGVYNIVSKKSHDKNKLEDEKVEFKTGHSGFFVFRDCPDFDSIDTFEGNIFILYESVKAGTKLRSEGKIRLNIAEVRKDIIIKSEPKNLQ